MTECEKLTNPLKKSRSLIKWASFAGILSCLLLHLLLADNGIGVISSLLASGIGCFAIFSFYFYYVRVRQVNVKYFPFFPIALLNIYLLFCLSVFWPYTSYIQSIHPPLQFFDIALLGVALFTLAFSLSYKYLPLKGDLIARIIDKILPNTVGHKTVEIQLPVWICLTTCAFARIMVGDLVDFQNISSIIAVLLFVFNPIVYFGYHLFFWVHGKTSFLSIMISFILSIVPAALQMTMHEMLWPLVVLFVAYIFKKGKVPVVFVVLAISIYILLNPVKLVYRGMIQELSTDGLASKIEIAIDSWEEVFKEGRRVKNKRIDSSQARLNELIIIADCMDRVPRTIEYDYGKSWVTLLYNFIPRFLWKEKPDLRKIQTSYWAVKFGYARISFHEKSAANLPSVVDGYWNFGWPGIIIVGVIFGSLTKLFCLVGTLRRPETTALGVMLLSQNMVNMCLGTIAGALPQKIVGIVVSMLILKILVGLFSIYPSRTK
jgi:hypothetical protein